MQSPKSEDKGGLPLHARPRPQALRHLGLTKETDQLHFHECVSFHLRPCFEANGWHAEDICDVASALFVNSYLVPLLDSIKQIDKIISWVFGRARQQAISGRPVNR